MISFQFNPMKLLIFKHFIDDDEDDYLVLSVKSFEQGSENPTGLKIESKIELNVEQKIPETESAQNTTLNITESLESFFGI